MGKAYSEEMQRLPSTLQWAAEQDVDLLKRAIQLYSDRGLLAVGSGGSFTAAAFAAELHLKAFGRPSQAITPLECFQLPGAASAFAAGMLLSAEGKNPDILASVNQLQLRGCPTIGVTLRAESTLVELCQNTGAASLAIYDMPWKKDGYLATNSLIATLVLLWRSYSSKSDFSRDFGKLLNWYEHLAFRLADLAVRSSLSSRALILHGVAGRIGALDLESKLTEGALAFGQVCNFRQFAHGRHLQLHAPDAPITVVSFGKEGDELASATLELLPPILGRVVDVKLPSLSFAATEVAAVLAAFLVTQAWAGDDKDPGRPDVPQFGRDLHFLDFSRLVGEPVPPSVANSSKRSGGAGHERLADHGQRYISQLSSAKFKALVCDFDGTFCDTVKRFEGLDDRVALELSRLATNGVQVAFATGRGAKLADVLRSKLPKNAWSNITLGCYSGSHIFALDDDNVAVPATDLRLVELERWLVDSRVFGPVITPNADAGQLSLRGIPGAEKVRVIAAINGWIAQQQHCGWRVFCSGHSLDVLTENASKLLVVDRICKRFDLDSNTQILRVGDAGDFGGNDYELLSSGLALSVDAVPPGWDQCWNFLPRGLSGVRGTEHYLRGLEASNGEARFSLAFLKATELALEEGLA